MAILPIILDGDNLGKRHKHLNDLVNEAFKNNVTLESIQNIPEQSAIDRLFKIKLADKYKNFNYIVQTLQDANMLYVSNAMKCTWLITDDEYKDIINPVNLEQNLYPQMRTNATNKMKHWIQLHLKHEGRNKEFYEYYHKDQIDYAIKFLPKCAPDFFLKELEIIPSNKIQPQFLKLLCERSAQAPEIYFKKITERGYADQKYIAKMQILLKTDPEIYFYIIENFFLEDFKRLNKKVTHYIMKRHRKMFDAKSELYAIRILDMSTVAKFLNSEETKELITKCARANYFGEHFHFYYETVKPLIKAIDPEERSKFCTSIFKDKKFEAINDPPYYIPKQPYSEQKESNILDKENENYDSALKGPPKPYPCCGRMSGRCKFYTELDYLYDEYRFKSFEITFNELRQRIRKESKMNIRQNMILVLVSKTGGRSESVETLMQYLLKQHSNEPINLRAAIVRSSVKRAFAWRWVESNWKLLLKFGRELGLDGSTSQVECLEGLHAVILRHILFNNEYPIYPSAVWNAFVDNFSPLNEYKLNASERHSLHERLPILLLSAAQTDLENPEISIKRLTEVCDSLDAYKLNIETYPGVIDSITKFAHKHPILAQSLLLRLFNAGIGRKLLFKENFEIVQTDASYVNALRHDPTLLTDTKFERLLLNMNDLHHDQFLQKLALYYGEKEGLATRFMQILKQKAHEQPHVKLARPMVLLIQAHSLSWPTLEVPKDDIKLQKYRTMMSSVQKHLYVTKKTLPMPLDSKDVSLAALANWIQTCSPKALREGMERLLLFPNHARLVLALRAPGEVGLVAKTLPHASRYRPMRALRVALRILRRNAQVFLNEDFEALKRLVSSIDLKGKTFERLSDLVRLNNVPRSFRADYSVALYHNLAKLGFGPQINSKSQPYYRIANPLIMCIKNHLDEIDADVVQRILKDFLENDFTAKSIRQFGEGDTRYASGDGYYDFRIYIYYFMKLLARYLITGKSKEDMENRMSEIYERFEQKLKELWHFEEVNDKTSCDFGYFNKFLLSVQCTKVFVNEIEYSLPLIEKLCLLGAELAPITENFGLNYRIQFIRLFRQAVKQSISERPEIFKGSEKDDIEATKIVLFKFGKVVAQDVEDLISKNFPSIRIFYTNALMMYLSAHGFYRFESIEIVIQGLLNDDSKPNAIIVGLSIYNNQFRDHERSANDILEQKIEDSIKNAKYTEIKFYFEHSEMSNYYSSNVMI